MEPERESGDATSAAHQLLVLVRLQELDAERDNHQGLIDGTPVIVSKREQALNDARQALKTAESELTRARADAHEAEVDLRQATDEIQKAELQLNTAKTNQEYQALTTHIEKLKTQSSSREEDTLMLYERIEEREAAVIKERKALGALEAEFTEFVATCEKDKQDASADLGSTEERRRALLSKLNGELLDSYERVRVARDGTAVVSAEGKICSGCGINLKPNDMARLMGAREIVTCDSCQRILYLPEILPASP